ncbi:MAG: polyprenyl diphosphate synthase [bacterium]
MEIQTKKNDQKIPEHVGIILDGNRRWAKERNLMSFDGHLAGYRKIRSVPKWFFDRGVKFVSVYAFSTENWDRDPEEVNYLMKLLRQAIDEEVTIANEQDFKILVSGRIDELPGDLPVACHEAISRTSSNKKGVLNICLNYGGRAEIVDAAKKMIRSNITEEQVHEGMFRKYFYQSEVPDLDVLVRTSGEWRTSGFLLWQAAYAELFFIKKYWPDYEESDVVNLLNEYNERDRRFGK